MRKTCTLAAILLLAGSVALAQAPATTTGSTDQNPATQNPQPSDQNTATQSSQPAQPQSSTPTGPASAAGDQNNQTFQGCLSGGNGSYTLKADTGSTYTLAGDATKLDPNVNKQVQVTGTVRNPESGSASIAVMDVSKIADTCTSQSGAMSGATSTTGAAAANTSNEPSTMPQSGTAAGAGSSAPSSTSSTDMNAAGSAQSSATATSTTDQSASTSQSNPSSMNSPTASQSSAQTANPSGQTETGAAPSAGQAAVPETGAATSAGQATAPAAAGTSATESAQGTESAQVNQGEKAGALPQTASPLPLLSLLGFGSLAGGLIARFRK